MIQGRPAAKTVVSLATTAEALDLVERLRRCMAELSALLAEETQLIRDAKVKAAAPLEARKTELSLRYMADLAILKANAGFVRRASRADFAALEQQSEALHRALELNLAVLATAHAVAEGIIRNVSALVQAKRAPSAYGANGRAAALPPRTSAPVAVSRSL